MGGTRCVDDRAPPQFPVLTFRPFRPEPMEGDRSSSTRRAGDSVREAEKWRRDSLPCAFHAFGPRHASSLISRRAEKDLGNTNYCVFVPRLQFERKTNAELVVRALNGLEIPAFVNDRNDICVDKFKMSPSGHLDLLKDAHPLSVCTCRAPHSSSSTQGRTTTARCSSTRSSGISRAC